MEVAIDAGLTASQAKRLVGATKEELEADAKELVESFGGKPGDSQRRRAAEQLRGGGDPTTTPAT